MKKFFVIGNPISHSLSPELHNFWIKKNKINAVYDKIKLDMNGSLTRLRVGVKPEGKVIAREGVKIFSKEDKR